MRGGATHLLVLAKEQSKIYFKHNADASDFFSPVQELSLSKKFLNQWSLDLIDNIHKKTSQLT